MPTPVRIIPSLLVKGSRLVKGVQYKNFRDAGSPASTAHIYDAQGADELTLLDIDASRENRPPDIEMLKKAAEECTTPLTFGGGITSMEIAREAIASGADKVSVTTGAIDNADLISELAHRYGSQAVVVGIDVKETSGGLALYDHRTETVLPRSVEAWIGEVQQLGCGEIRISFVDREGMRNGFPLATVSKLRALIRTPFVIEGGAGNLDHVDEVFNTNIDAISLGTMLIFSDNNIVQIKRHLEARKRNIRQW